MVLWLVGSITSWGTYLRLVGVRSKRVRRSDLPARATRSNAWVDLIAILRSNMKHNNSNSISSYYLFYSSEISCRLSLVRLFISFLVVLSSVLICFLNYLSSPIDPHYYWSVWTWIYSEYLFRNSWIQDYRIFNRKSELWSYTIIWEFNNFLLSSL